MKKPHRKPDAAELFHLCVCAFTFQSLFSWSEHHLSNLILHPCLAVLGNTDAGGKSASGAGDLVTILQEHPLVGVLGRVAGRGDKGFSLR
jgi:hypothetical protein